MSDNSELYAALAASIEETAEAKATAKAELIQTRQLSEQLVAASQAKNQFIPGTSKTAESLRVERLGELEAQRKKQAIAEAADFDNLQIILGQDLAKLANEQRTITAKIAKDSSVSLFDDPLTALANAFTLPWDEQALAGVTQKIDVTTKAMNSINNHVQNSAQTVEAVKTKVTEASIASETEALANMFSVKAINAKLDAIKNNSAAVDRVLQFGRYETEQLFRTVQAHDNEEARQQRREQHAKSMELLKLQQASAARAEKKFAEEEDHNKRIVGLVNSALLASGKNPIDLNTVKLLPKDKIEKLIEVGMRLQTSPVGTFSFGDTVQERFDNSQALGWIPNEKLPAQQIVMEMQLKARSNAAETAGKDKAAIENQTEANFAKDWVDGQKNIREGSPFKAPAPILFARNSDIIKHPIWQKYVTPTLNESNARLPLNEKVVSLAAADAVAAGEISSTEAAVFLSNVFKQAVIVNNTVNEFPKIAGRAQTMYGMRADTGMFGKETVDMTDPVQANLVIQSINIRRFGLVRAKLGTGKFSGPVTNPPVSQPSFPNPANMEIPEGFIRPTNLPAQFQDRDTGMTYPPIFDAQSGR